MLSKMSDLIFIDDNDEVAEVNASCPGITSLNIPIENAEVYESIVIFFKKTS